MKLMRLTLAALAISLVAACTNDITAPSPLAVPTVTQMHPGTSPTPPPPDDGEGGYGSGL